MNMIKSPIWQRTNKSKDIVFKAVLGAGMLLNYKTLNLLLKSAHQPWTPENITTLFSLGV